MAEAAARLPSRRSKLGALAAFAASVLRTFAAILHAEQ